MSSLLLALALVPAAFAADAKPPSEFMKSAALFQQKCANCHTIGGGSRVGPDLKGVLQRHERDWLLGFIQQPSAYLDSDPAAKKLLETFNGVRMSDLNLNRAQVETILSYIEAAESGPAAEEEGFKPIEVEPLRGKLRMPDEKFAPSIPGLLASALLLLLAAAAAWRLGAAAPAALLIVFAAGVGYWSLGGRRTHPVLGVQQGYAPVQPIAYSHKLHAGKMGISCFYCHYSAERSQTAGVPPAGVCMNCHRVVKNRPGTKEPSPEIAKLLAAYGSNGDGKPIEWVRVHNLPDFVHFSHRAHIGNNIQCQECHGPVQTMERVRQAADLSMGWCVNCHRQGPGKAPTHWKRSQGPTDCAACHR